MNPRIYLVVLAAFAINIDNFAMAGILPEIAQSFHVTLGVAGQLVTVYALTYGFGAPLLAALLAPLSSRHILMGALFSFSLANAIAAISPTFSFLLGCRILAGVCAALISPAAYALAAALALDGKRGRALALVGSGSSAATIVGLPLGAWIGQTIGWPLTFCLVSCLSIVAVLMLGLVGIPNLSLPVTVGLRARFSLMVQSSLVLALLPTFFWSLAHFVMYTYVVPLLHFTIHNASAVSVSWLILIWGIGSVLGNGLGGYLVDHIGSARTIIGSFLLLAASLCLLPLLSFLLPVAVALLFLWGIAVWSAWPALQAYLHNRFPQMTGQVLALNASFDFLGSAAGAGLGGLVITFLPIQTIGWFGSAFALVALVLFILSRWRNLSTGDRLRHRLSR